MPAFADDLCKVLATVKENASSEGKVEQSNGREMGWRRKQEDTSGHSGGSSGRIFLCTMLMIRSPSFTYYYYYQVSYREYSEHI